MNKVFDWKEAEKFNSPTRLAWLKDNWDKKMSLEEFTTEIRSLNVKGKSPSSCRNQYRRLGEFGFFQVNNSV